MKVKLLLGSIGVVVSLILVSLTSVVSIQSTPSCLIAHTPLFSIRTQKAINQVEKEFLASGYLGKGRDTLQIPMPENRKMLYQKVIEQIGRMDNAAFHKFIAMAIQYKNHDATLKNINSQYIIAVLNQIKNNQNMLLNQDIDGDDDSVIQITIQYPTQCIIGCLYYLIWSVIGMIAGLLLIIYCTMAYPEHCTIPTSWSMCCH